MLSKSIGTLGWNGRRCDEDGVPVNARDGDKLESINSDSISILSIVDSANDWANFRRRSMDSGFDGSLSSGWGIKARMVEIARLIGEDGSKAPAGLARPC